MHQIFKSLSFIKSMMIRTIKVVLREVGLMNFDDPGIPSLEAYFKMCSSQKITHFTGFTMSGIDNLVNFML